MYMATSLVGEICMFFSLVLILTIVMITRLTTILGLLALFFGQIDLRPKITTPAPDSVLQGQVAVTGSTDIPGFVSADLAFAYQSDLTGTWFPLLQTTQAVRDNVLVVWDTSTITDGTYKLRLRVTTQDGQILETIVEGLRVRNYTPIEAQPTPASELQTATEMTAAVTPSPVPPTPTELPANPARVTNEALTFSLKCGLVGAVGAFLALGVYLMLRRAARR